MLERNASSSRFRARPTVWTTGSAILSFSGTRKRSWTGYEKRFRGSCFHSPAIACKLLRQTVAFKINTQCHSSDGAVLAFRGPRKSLPRAFRQHRRSKCQLDWIGATRPDRKKSGLGFLPPSRREIGTQIHLLC